MSRWLLILLLQLSLLAPLRPAHASTTENGPTSRSEAEVLWKEGKKAFEQARYLDSVDLLQRLVDRYPGYEGYLEAHLYLGRALLKLDDADRAIPDLKYYISATSGLPAGQRAKILLGEGYLRLGKYHEALLDAEEVTQAMRIPPEILANGLLLKARALIELNHDLRAHDSLDSARSVAKKELKNSPLILGEAAAIELELKSRACASMPSDKKLEEEQTIDQLSRRGTCTLEALLIYRDALQSGRPAAAVEATREILSTFQGYRAACENPPEPPVLRPMDRDQKQKVRYREELRAKLEQGCKKRYNEARNILTGWKGSLPPATAPSVDEVLKELP